MSNNLKLINTNTINSKPIRNFIKVKNTGGPKGDKGDTGATGPQGPQGPAGQAATINIGETTTLLPGQTATVTNTGTQQNATLNFGIPQGLRGPTGAQGPKGDTGPQGLKGDKGNDGAAASVTVGITNTGEPGSNASVTNLGTSSNAILSFTIPTGSRGPQGQTGPQGPKGEDGKDGKKGDKGDAGQAATVTVGSTTTTNPGTSATVTNSGTTSAAVLNFGIPRGATGSVKSEVVSELPETGEGDTFYLVNREATEQTATGKTINFTNSENTGDITDAQIDGETSQNTLSGKNLFNKAAATLNYRIGSDGSPYGDSSFFLSDFIPVNPNTEYRITPTNGYSTSALAYYDSSKTFISRTLGGTWYNVSTPANAAYIRFATNKGYIDTAQCEKGSTATSYEPYCGGAASPNPGYPQAVKTVTGENVVKICGKNLFEVTASSSSVSDGVTYTKISDSSFSIASGGSSSWARADIALPQPLESNTTYTFRTNFSSTNPSITSVRVAFRTASAEASAFNLANGQTATLSTGNNVITLLRIYISTNTEYNATVTFSNTQLELGNQASTYEAYKSQSYEIDLASKNLFDVSKAQEYKWLNAGTGWIIDSSDKNIVSEYIHVEVGKTYTISGIDGLQWNLFSYAYPGAYGTREIANSTTIRTYTATAEWLRFGVGGGDAIAIKGNIQLEKGSTPTTYADFWQIELCKIDTYQDYIYKSEGNWYKHKAIGKGIYDGSEDENWTSSAANRADITISDAILGSPTNNPVLCNRYKAVWATANGNIFLSGLWHGAGIVDTTNMTSLSAWRTYLASNNVEIYYALATPTDTEITNEALITQLDNLASAALYSGTNNIFTVTPNEVPTLELDYVTYDKYNQNKVYIYNEATGVWQIIVQ